MVVDRFHYELERSVDDRVSIMLYGELIGTTLPGLGDAVQALLEQIASGGSIVVDLTNVAKCDPGACRVLAGIQRKLGAHGCRTAWLASRPRIRGAAWWIVHASGDPHAMPVTGTECVEEWLTCEGTRLDEIEARTEGALGRAHERLPRA